MPLAEEEGASVKVPAAPGAMVIAVMAPPLVWLLKTRLSIEKGVSRVVAVVGESTVKACELKVTTLPAPGMPPAFTAPAKSVDQLLRPLIGAVSVFHLPSP